MPRDTNRISIMNIVTKISLFVAFMLISANAFGQNVGDSSSKSDKSWGIGTSITYPMADIYMIQGSYSPGEHSDILCGAAFQNWKNSQGRANAYTLLLGYRRFIWRGLHTEMELWPAYNPFRSSIDGKTYTGLELWMSVRVGYKLEFNTSGIDLYILAQPGIGFGVIRDNPWPDKEKDDKAVFEPQMIVGIKL